MQLQTRSPESKFLDKYNGVIFIEIDEHLKKLLQKYKGVPILWITVVWPIDVTMSCLWDVSVVNL